MTRTFRGHSGKKAARSARRRPRAKRGGGEGLESEERTMEVTARLRYLQASPQKVRLVADLIRGKGVQEAANVLELTNKSAARPLRKLLTSAIANAENRDAARRRRHALRQGDLRRRRPGG